MKTIGEIIEAAGGVRSVAVETGMTYQAVKRWQESGIPDWHWPAVIRATGVTPEQLFEANQNCPDRAARNRETAA